MRMNRVKILRIASGYGAMLQIEAENRTKKHEASDIQKFAQIYGVSARDILLYEAQEKVPPYAFAKKICEERNVPIEFIYGYEYSKRFGIEDVKDPTVLEDYKKSTEDYKIYIEFKACNCTFADSFLISQNFEAIQSLEDLTSAAADGKVDMYDPRLANYLRSQFNIKE